MVYVWSASGTPPTQCPNNSEHTIDASNATVMQTVTQTDTEISNLPLTPFDRVLTSEETVLIDVKPGMGLSALRDRVDTVGGGSVTSEVGTWEYQLTAPNAASSASLRTAERGPFVAGLCAEVGIGGRLGSFPQGDQTVRYGAFDNVSGNGYFFEIGAIGISVVVMKDGAEKHRAHMTQFNVDAMDGAGPSKLVLDALRGYAWTIRYAMYGYGCVEFSVAAENINLEQHLVPMHRYYTRSDPAISCPYLPVWVEAASPSHDTPLDVFVTGRKLSILGSYDPDTRDTCVCHDVSTANADLGFTTILAVRKRALCDSMPVEITEIECSADGGGAVLVEAVMGIVSETNVWSSIDGIPATETVLEAACDTEVAITERVSLWRGYVHASSQKPTSMRTHLSEDSAILLRVKNISAAGRVAVSLRFREWW